jgi:hypothetical protein
MSAMEIDLVLNCPAGAADCLTRMRGVLDCVERAGPTWASLDQWEQDLPGWFVHACARPMSDEEAQDWLNRWRGMSKAEQSRVSEEQSWSLPDWLYWMEPSHSVWRWTRAKLRSALELEVTLAIEGLPVALGAFQWLARAAGAERVRVVSKA